MAGYNELKLLGNEDAAQQRPGQRRCKTGYIRVCAAVSLVAAAVVACVFVFFNSTGTLSTKGQYCAAFKESPEQSWEGVYVDLFSPDDKNPASRRFIDLRRAKGGGQFELEISADTGTELWGRRFHPNGTINPVLEQTTDGSSAQRKTSFLSKIPTDSPLYPYALNGALNFTVTNGHVRGERVLRWNGLYNGKGGPWNNGSIMGNNI